MQLLARVMILATVARGFTPISLRTRAFSLSSSAGAELTSDTDNAFEGFSTAKAFMFPGQGAQVVGMAESVVKEVRSK